MYDIDSQVKKIDGKRFCVKRYPDEGRTSGGVLALWCEHGISYGFHMLESAESLRDVMAAIMRTWEQAPPFVVYDNACHLMFYCHSREWNYWKETTFYIDCFHQYNHIACSLAHSITNSKHSSAIKFLYMNTSVSESGNAGLSKLKTSLRRMAADAAFICILIQLEIQNSVKINQILDRSKWDEEALSAVLTVQQSSDSDSELESESDSDSFLDFRIC
jgi:hypothetical protein